MTIREAFAVAGYSVPDDYTIHHEWRSTSHWYATPIDEAIPNVFMERMEWDYDHWERGSNGSWYGGMVNIANLPAEDALQALPDAIRKVVSLI